MKEQLSTSAQKPKIELPNKELVGVKKDLKSDSAKLPKPTGWRLLVLPFKQKEKTKEVIFYLFLKRRNLPYGVMNSLKSFFLVQIFSQLVMWMT